MWILVAVVFKTISLGSTFPVYDKILNFDSLNACEKRMQSIYNEYKSLQKNYPLTVEFKTNDNNQKYMIYSFKPDYTKPNINTYYHCIKTYRDRTINQN